MNFRKALGVSFFFFLVSTMVSQSAMDGFSILSILLLICLWFQERRTIHLFSKTGVELPLLLFSLAVVLSFVVNWRTQTLAVMRIFELKWILNFYLMIAILKVLNPDWKSFQRLQIFIWISALFSLVTPLLGFDPLQGSAVQIDRVPSGMARAGGFFSNPMTFAHLNALIFFLAFGISCHLFDSRKKEGWTVFLLSCCLGLGLLLSFTRGVWIGIFVGLILTGFAFQKRWGLRILGALLVIGSSLFVLVPSIHSRALQFMDSASYDNERIWIWKANLRIFLDHPVFGVGYGENTLALKQYYKLIGAPEGLIISHSHNQYLNILSGLGLFGFIFYFWLVSSIFIFSWNVYRSLKQSELPAWIKGLALGSVGAQISFLIGGLTESNFEHSKVRYVLLLVWAIPYWVHSKLGDKISKMKEKN